MGTFSGGYMLDPATGRPVVGRTVAVTSWPDEVPLTPDDGALATGPDGGYGIFSVAGRDAVQLRAGGVEQVVVSIEASLSGIGTSGSGILNVSGTVNLTDTPGIREVYATASATVEGVALTAGDAAVFRYLAGAWTYMVVGEHTTWQTAPGAPDADTTAPTPGTLAVTGSGIAGTTRTLTVTGASDAGGLHAQPYRFSTDGGSTWSTYQSSNAFTTGALTAGTYQPRVMVRDAAGNTATASASDFTVAGSATPLAAAYAGNADNGTSQAAYTFTAVPIGEAAADRTVIVAVFGRSTTSQTITSVTVAGSSATLDQQEARVTNTTFSILGWARRTVPAGTTADVVVNFSGAIANCHVVTFTITGNAATLVDYDSGTGYSPTLALAVDSASNGVALALPLSGGTASGVDATFSWSGWTPTTSKHAPRTGYTFMPSHAQTSGAPVSGTLSTSAPGTNISGSVITYGPAA